MFRFLPISAPIRPASCPAFGSAPRPVHRGLCVDSVLRVYLGMVLHANKRYLDALDMLELASKSEPSNPQVGCA